MKTQNNKSNQISNKRVNTRKKIVQEDSENIKNFFLKILIVVIIYLIFAYFYNYFLGNTSKRSAQMGVSDSNILTIISQSVALPAGIPEFYRVDKQTELAAKDSFYKNASEGDILVYFDQSKKGIIYNNTEKRVRYIGDYTLNQAFK